MLSPFSVEASVFLAAYGKMQLYGKLTHEGVAHCYIWSEDSFFASFDRPTRQQLKNGMQSLARDWECAMCLSSTQDTEGTTSLWKCFHVICNECMQSEHGAKLRRTRSSCPLCRAKMIDAFPCVAPPCLVGDTFVT